MELEAQAGSPIRVLAVDDHPVVHAGLRFTLREEDGYVFCGEAVSVEQALSLAREHTPHLIVVDLNMGGEGGDIVAQIRKASPHSALLVFSMNPEELFARQALESGANGYLMKKDGFDALLQAVRTVLAGAVYLSPRMRLRAPASDLSSLTMREMEVFRRIGEGRTIVEIAEELKLSAKTVFVHRDNIRGKLGIENSAAMTRQAMAWVLGRAGET